MSMTRKEAIKVLKNGGIEVCGEADRISEFIAALDVALDALIPPTRENELEAENRELKERIVNWRKYMAPTREQVEKVWRGEWVIGEPDVLGVPIHCSRCGWGSDHADQRKWMEYNGHLFCGHCGAPMTDEAVDMAMERWKEAIDGETD